jgi:hypothetical protein
MAKCARELSVAFQEEGDVAVPGVHQATSGRAA